MIEGVLHMIVDLLIIFVSGEILVFVVNHPNMKDYDTVEKFRLDMKTMSLQHLKTYRDEMFRE